MTEHVETKHRLQSVGSKSVFERILEETTLNDTEKSFLRLYYIEKKDLRYIGDKMNISEGQASKMHRRLLRAVRDVI